MTDTKPDYKYLDKLNTQQREAVEYIDGPSLVIAGAGSGKTRVLTYKIVHLLNSGYEPWRILALTFTNKAAREMKERVASLTGNAIATKIPMGTFHSVFLRILHANAQNLGYKSSFSIYDATDSRNLIKIIIKELGLNDKNYKPAAIASTISNAKNALLSPEQYEHQYYALDLKAKRPMVSRIFQIYNERCKVANAMDFDDIILNMHSLLRDNEEARKKYSQLFRYILIDEYQDTNFAQHSVISLLAGEKKRVCVVGDDAQSIYSFRGANIDNIIELGKTFPGLRTFKLERNYRSTQNIVNAASSLIACNTRQLPKHVYSEKPEGSKVGVVRCYSDYEEASMVAADVNSSVLSNHESYEDYAILYRTNAQSRVLEEAFRKRSIAYRIYGGTAFYQRKEVKDAIAYFRLAVNPDDDEALRRVINYPARGIGDTTMKKVQAAAIAAGKSLWSVVSDASASELNVNSGTIRKLDAFSEMIQSFVDSTDRLNAYEIGQDIYNRTGMLAVLAGDNTPESISRKENLRELLAGMREFVDLRNASGDDDVSLSSFLSVVMLATDQDEKDQTNGEKVTMMTAHAAKGLEFKHVYIVGVEEELFPSAMSMDSLRNIEEERRLLYVAMTRAMESCTLTYARTRFRNGQTVSTSPSRFLRDINPKYLEIEALGESDSNRIYDLPAYKRYDSAAGNIIKQSMIQTPVVSRPYGNLRSVRNIDTSVTARHTVKDVKPGMKIEHSKFGIGRIVEIGNVSGQDSIVVDFGSEGIKKLLLQFAKFNICD